MIFELLLSHIMDLHSVLPESVHILTLTTTATSEVLKVVKIRLS